ncbi:hypothetical protein PG993_011961 [Apiospora rasikravindrae]|uniref:Uncharacterized protein n=1 Tax=Apiospora rasikravindrae TaxID=990691 RepID=A0ABR1S140_9PEZI
MSYKPQSTSILFLTAIEIRRGIYADLLGIGHVHVTHLPSQAGFRLTRCFDPDLGAEHVGDERRPVDDDPDSVIWARRLTSTHFETLDMMREQVCFHITDLDTVDSLFQHLSASPASSGSFGFQNLVAPHIQKLEVTLSLPLAFFEYFDDRPSAPGRELVPLFQGQARTWTEMPQGILEHLPSLRNLSIWLDHSQRPYWSVVHERAVLCAFEQLATSGRIDLLFDLPMIGSRIGGPTRLLLGEENTSGYHFNNPSSTPITIRRRLRQRQRVVGRRADTGAPTVRYCHDFPLGLGFDFFDGLSVAKIASCEWEMERRSENVQQFLAMSTPGSMVVPARAGFIFGGPHALQDHGHLCL